MTKPRINDISLLHKMLSYDQVTGILTWKVRTEDMFADTTYKPRYGRSASTNAKFWNKRFSLKRAGRVNDQGYRVIRIKGHSYQEHRLAWMMTYGSDVGEGMEIDHINGVRDDNRISNLREVTKSENGRNRWLMDQNSSGTAGVCWHKSYGMWQVEVCQKYIGRYETLDHAIIARQAAEKALNFGDRVHKRDPSKGATGSGG